MVDAAVLSASWGALRPWGVEHLPVQGPLRPPLWPSVAVPAASIARQAPEARERLPRQQRVLLPKWQCLSPAHVVTGAAPPPPRSWYFPCGY